MPHETKGGDNISNKLSTQLITIAAEFCLVLGIIGPLLRKRIPACIQAWMIQTQGQGSVRLALIVIPLLNASKCLLRRAP